MKLLVYNPFKAPYQCGGREILPNNYGLMTEEQAALFANGTGLLVEGQTNNFPDPWLRFDGQSKG